MFKKSIISTPLTTDIADLFFKNIIGDKYIADNSFIATLRALVAPRMEEDDNIFFITGLTRYHDGDADCFNPESMIYDIQINYHLLFRRNSIIVHSFDGDDVINQAYFQAVESNFTTYCEEFQRVEKIRKFYHKSFQIDCYINPKNRTAIIFVEKLDNRKLHYLQISIPAILPWYFNTDEGISDLERELLYSLRETTSDKYEDCLRRIAEQYNFREERIRQLLSGFETHVERAERDKVRASIDDIDCNIRVRNEEIGELISKRNDACIKLMGLEQKLSEDHGESEIMEYFMCNRKLYLEDVDDDVMRFSVKDYLTYFDREMAEIMIDNPHSFVYRHDGTEYGENAGISAGEMKMLMREIFVEENPRLRIKFCAAYKFRIGGTVYAQVDHDFGYDFDDAMPNPHIDKYRCMGNYQMTINEMLAANNYIVALEQCVASAKSLNWADSTVMNSFMSAMWGDDGHKNRCIELPDGHVVTPSEAIQWLKKQQNEKTKDRPAEEKVEG